MLSSLVFFLFVLGAASSTFVNPVVQGSVRCDASSMVFEIDRRSAIFNITGIVEVQALDAKCATNQIIGSAFLPPDYTYTLAFDPCHVNFTYIYGSPDGELAAYTNQRFRIYATATDANSTRLPDPPEDIAVWCLFPATATKSTNHTIHGGGQNGGGGNTTNPAGDVDMWLEDETGANISYANPVAYGTQLKLKIKLRDGQKAYNATMPTYCTVGKVTNSHDYFPFVTNQCPNKPLIQTLTVLEKLERISIKEYELDFTAFTFDKGAANEALVFTCQLNLCINDDLARCNQSCWSNAVQVDDEHSRDLSFSELNNFQPNRLPGALPTSGFRKAFVSVTQLAATDISPSVTNSDWMYIVFGLLGFFCLILLCGCGLCLIRFCLLGDGGMVMGGGGCPHHQQHCHCQQTIPQQQHSFIAVPTPSLPTTTYPLDSYQPSRYNPVDNWDMGSSVGGVSSKRSLISTTERQSNGRGLERSYY